MNWYKIGAMMWTGMAACWTFIAFTMDMPEVLAAVVPMLIGAWMLNQLGE